MSTAPSYGLAEMYFHDADRHPQMPRAEEHAVAVKAASGDRAARHKLVEANLRFVVRIAIEYQSSGIPLPDLIQWGNLGMMEAAKRFDPGQGVKFISYAVWYVRQKIRDNLRREDSAVVWPSNVEGLSHKVRHYDAERAREGLPPGTDEEVAAAVGANSVQQVRAARARMRTAVRLDAPLSVSESQTGVVATMGDMLPYDEDTGPFEAPDVAAEVSQRDGRLRDVVATLPKRERRILTRYFGLDDGEQETLEQIAQDYGITRQRVRQIKERALGRLRTRLTREKVA